MIILDLDNCIADDKWRISLIHWDNPNKFLRFHNYHMASPGDAVCNQHLFLGRKAEDVAIFTSRPIEYKWLANMWLNHHHIQCATLFMREHADLPSPEVKRIMLRSLLKTVPIMDIEMAYDDREDVIEMYKKEGIPAQRIAINNYEQGEWYGPKERG